MTHHVVSLTPDMMMTEVLEKFRLIRISGGPVVDEAGSLIGVISLQDLITAMLKGDLDSHVKDYMSSNLITVRGSDPVVEALKKFVGTNVGRLPVLNNDNKLIGILTKGDITRGLLNALKKDYQVEEIRRYRARHLFDDIESDRTSLILRYSINVRDFTHGGAASSNIKRALLRLGANPQIARRVGIAVYEAEMNLIIHTTNGGTIRVEIEHMMTAQVLKILIRR
jgi:predicted transcriptional regulator